MTRRVAGALRGAVGLAAGLAAAALLPAAAGAQCRPPAGSNEAKLLAYYAAPIVFTPQRAPATMRHGVALGGELTWIPRPDASLQRTGLCFAPKEETTQLSPVFPRPRLAVALPFGVLVEGSWLPPLRVAGAQANLVSGAVSVSWPALNVGGRALLHGAARAHVTRGWVRGAITCAKSALQTADASRPCYGSDPSRDTFHPNMWGLDGSFGSAVAGGRGDFYFGGGVNWLAPRFRVGFTSGDGFVDTTRVEVDLRRTALFAGGSWRVLGPWAATGQIYAVPEDVTLVRIGILGAVRR